MSTERPPEVLDRLFDCLSDSRRRLVCHVLAAADGRTVEVSDVVDAVVARERSGSTPAPADHRENVAIDLHHVQLPKLDAAGIVEYDPDARTVTYRPDEIVERCLAYDARLSAP